MYPQLKNDYVLVVSHTLYLLPVLNPKSYDGDTCRTHVDVDANGPTAVGANPGCPSGHCVVGGK